MLVGRLCLTLPCLAATVLVFGCPDTSSHSISLNQSTDHQNRFFDCSAPAGNLRWDRLNGALISKALEYPGTINVQAVRNPVQLAGRKILKSYRVIPSHGGYPIMDIMLIAADKAWMEKYKTLQRLAKQTQKSRQRNTQYGIEALYPRKFKLQCGRVGVMQAVPGMAGAIFFAVLPTGKKNKLIFIANYTKVPDSKSISNSKVRVFLRELEDQPPLAWLCNLALIVDQALLGHRFKKPNCPSY